MKQFLLILQIAPSILSMIQSLESLIPGSGNGKHKLDLLLGITRVAFAVEPTIQKDIQAHQLDQAVTDIAAVSVGVLNALGIFSKVFAKAPAAA